MTTRHSLPLALPGAIMLVAVVMSLAALFAWLAINLLHNHTIQRTAALLERLNQIAVYELHRQHDEMIQTARELISEPDHRHRMLRLLASQGDAGSRFELRLELARELFPMGYRAFFLITPEFRIALGMKDADEQATLPEEPRRAIQRLMQGMRAVVTHPFRFRDEIWMWVLFPVEDDSGRAKGWLALGGGPKHRFSRATINSGRLLDSGETYLVDESFRFLSESRFARQLQQTGLLRPGEQETLRLRALDPGRNLLEQPLTGPLAAAPPTLAAREAAGAHQRGRSIKPYRDYRGVPVFGAWTWDDALNAAIITEIDEREAMAGFWQARRIVIALVAGLLFLGLLSLLAVFAFHRRRIQAERETGRMRDLLFKSTAEGIYGVDTEGRCIFVNDACQRLLGYAEEEMIGRNMHELIHHKRADGTPYPIEICSIYRAFHERTRIHRDDEVFWRKDGEPLEVEYWSHPIFEGDRCVGAVVSFLDIGPRREAERERAAIERSMQHTQRLESLGVLAGGIAHDFNNILAAIVGNAWIAENKVFEDPLKAKERIALIHQSAEPATVLCKHSLAYSGNGQFVIKPIDLSALVEEMTHLLEVSIAKSVVIQYHLARNLPPVMADEAQIQQVVMNLITNASEAIGDKSGVISLTTGIMRADAEYLRDCYGDKPAPGRYAWIEVSDTGCGMDEATIARIFDPFFTTKETGHGLGMSAVLGIVRGHKGALKVYSEPGRGTTFKLLLPAAATEAHETPEEARLRLSGGARVLVVDDEETVREMACVMLEDMGFETIAARDGEEALRLFEQEHRNLDLVLTDLTMPHMSGHELFSRIQQIAPGFPIVLTSGYNEQEAIQQFSGKGLAGFVQKPFTPTALAHAIRQALGGEEDG
ncbi:MAG: response regulator [Mariprofundaceae bacterium]